MIQATGLTAANSTPGAAVSAAGLEAQLARLQKELSECVNCASANTTEGKAKIQAISDKISVVNARLDAVSVESKRGAETQKTGQSAESQQGRYSAANAENRPEAGSTAGGIINIRA